MFFYITQHSITFIRHYTTLDVFYDVELNDILYIAPRGTKKRRPVLWVEEGNVKQRDHGQRTSRSLFLRGGLVVEWVIKWGIFLATPTQMRNIH